MIDLDRAATAPVREEVLRAMWPHLAAPTGNPSSRHDLGRRAAADLEAARVQIAAALGARSSDVVITSGGTESDNLAIRGIALAQPRGRRILAAPTEHPAVLETCRALVRLHGFTLELLPVDSTGTVNPRDVRDAAQDTALVTVAVASSEIGTIQPIAEIAAAAHAIGARMHTDAVQAVGQLPLHFRDLGVDAMSIAGHKIGAPVGVGALLARRSLALEPLMYGGRQESSRRAGTENVAAAAGLALALQLSTDGLTQRAASLASRRDAMRQVIAAALPDVQLVGDPTRRLPGHLAWCVPGAEAEALLLRLDERGVRVSSGTACGEDADEPSEALLACGISPELARGAIRASFDVSTTARDLARAAELLIAAVRELRSLGEVTSAAAAGPQPS